MIAFRTYLIEGRDAPVYHATETWSAYDILEKDMIRGNTLHPTEYVGKRKKDAGSVKPHTDPKLSRGISLTRDFRFAKNWAPIVFQFDQRRLAQRYRIVPHNFYVSAKISGPQAFRNESEEFLLGDMKNATKYMTKVWISYDIMDEVAERLENALKKRGIPIERF